MKDMESMEGKNFMAFTFFMLKKGSSRRLTVKGMKLMKKPTEARLSLHALHGFPSLCFLNIKDVGSPRRPSPGTGDWLSNECLA
jgi:hypothetical protein